MDFTIKRYKSLLKALKENSYGFQTFEEFLNQPLDRSIVLRHDVDLLPHHSLRFASIQYDMGIKGTYYFRAVPESWDEKVIGAIADMGHEIGYHYENLTTCKGDMNKAIEDFGFNLDKLRNLAPVRTICMHGSPRSKYDSKDLWKARHYNDFQIIGEPYFDVDFDKVFYLTDTGRRWDGHKVSVRDKVSTAYKLSYHRTDEIISAIENGELPDQVMFTFHPQRWNEGLTMWMKELLLQNTKNTIKKYFFVK